MLRTGKTYIPPEEFNWQPAEFRPNPRRGVPPEPMPTRSYRDVPLPPPGPVRVDVADPEVLLPPRKLRKTDPWERRESFRGTPSKKFDSSVAFNYAPSSYELSQRSRGKDRVSDAIFKAMYGFALQSKYQVKYRSYLEEYGNAFSLPPLPYSRGRRLPGINVLKAGLLLSYLDTKHMESQLTDIVVNYIDTNRGPLDVYILFVSDYFIEDVRQYVASIPPKQIAAIGAAAVAPAAGAPAAPGGGPPIGLAAPGGPPMGLGPPAPGGPPPPLPPRATLTLQQLQDALGQLYDMWRRDQAAQTINMQLHGLQAVNMIDEAAARRHAESMLALNLGGNQVFQAITNQGNETLEGLEALQNNTLRAIERGTGKMRDDVNRYSDFVEGQFQNVKKIVTEHNEFINDAAVQTANAVNRLTESLGESLPEQARELKELSAAVLNASTITENVKNSFLTGIQDVKTSLLASNDEKAQALGTRIADAQRALAEQAVSGAENIASKVDGLRSAIRQVEADDVGSLQNVATGLDRLSERLGNDFAAVAIGLDLLRDRLRNDIAAAIKQLRDDNYSDFTGVNNSIQQLGANLNSIISAKAQEDELIEENTDLNTSTSPLEGPDMEANNVLYVQRRPEQVDPNFEPEVTFQFVSKPNMNFQGYTPDRLQALNSGSQLYRMPFEPKLGRYSIIGEEGLNGLNRPRFEQLLAEKAENINNEYMPLAEAQPVVRATVPLEEGDLEEASPRQPPPFTPPKTRSMGAAEIQQRPLVAVLDDKTTSQQQGKVLPKMPAVNLARDPVDAFSTTLKHVQKLAINVAKSPGKKLLPKAQEQLRGLQDRGLLNNSKGLLDGFNTLVDSSSGNTKKTIAPGVLSRFADNYMQYSAFTGQGFHGSGFDNANIMQSGLVFHDKKASQWLYMFRIK